MIKKFTILITTLVLSMHSIFPAEATVKKVPLTLLAKKYPDAVFIRGTQEGKKIALTFDDGPDKNITVKILDILKEKNVRATFFVTGENAKAHSEILKRMDREGHCIANHTWSHINVLTHNKDMVIREINQTNALIKQLTGQENNLFRPPYSGLNEDHAELIIDAGYQIIGYTADSNDWQGLPKRQLLRNVLQSTVPGTIVIQHNRDDNKLLNTVKALPELIDRLNREGYTFVTVPEILDNFKETVIKVNGHPVLYKPGDSFPLVVNETTLAPARKTFENLGAIAEWNSKKNTLTIIKNSNYIILKEKSARAYVNEQVVTLPVPPLIDPYTKEMLVPLRFVSEQLGGSVKWKSLNGHLLIDVYLDKYGLQGINNLILTKTS